MNGNRWRRVLGCLAALWCAATVGACSSPSRQAGTNTNWIKCAVDADCAGATTAAACVGGVCKSADGRTAITAAKTSECPPSPTLGADASYRATCHPSRAYVTCRNPDGSGSSCTTDGEVTCSGASGGACHNECTTDEYAAACGGVGPGPVPEPPAGCRSVAALPAGVVFYCCPCGS